MAFPVEQTADRQTGTVTVASTTWTLTYPTNVQRGDLIVVILAIDAVGAPSGPVASGFTGRMSGLAAGTVVRGWTEVKYADGTESGNFNVALNASEAGAWAVLRISNWFGVDGNDERTWHISLTDGSAVNGGLASGTSTNPTAGTANPHCWGAEDALWIDMCFFDGSAICTGPTPSGSTGGTTVRAANEAGLAFAFREQSVASQAGSAFTLDSSVGWTAYRLVIRGDNQLVGYPKLTGIYRTAGTTASANASVAIPRSVRAGDTILVLHRCATSTAGHGYPAGFNELFDDNSDASDDRTSVAWKKADGSEAGTSITITQDNQKYASFAMVLTGAADPALEQAPQFATLVTGTSATPDPGTVTPTGGAKNYMMIWAAGWEGEQVVDQTVQPTNYTGQAQANSGTAGAITTNVGVGVAFRQVNASSENPGSMSITTSDDWTATVIAVHPAPGTGPHRRSIRRSNQAVHRASSW